MHTSEHTTENPVLNICPHLSVCFRGVHGICEVVHPAVCLQQRHHGGVEELPVHLLQRQGETHLEAPQVNHNISRPDSESEGLSCVFVSQVDILNKVDWNAWMFTPGMPPVKPQ